MVAYGYIFLAVVLLSLGQIAQKLAANRLVAHAHNTTLTLLVFKELWWALSCLALGLIAWLIALSSIEVSKAYPLLSISFAMTAILARLQLGEFLSRTRWLGIVLISIGAGMVAIA